MGFALPAVIGAMYDKRKHHYCFSGDGAFQMNIQELQWIVNEKLPIKMIILKNNSLGLIRQQQDSIFSKRYYGATKEYGFTAPDFSRIASAYGIHSYVLKQEDFSEWDENLLKSFFLDEEPWLIEICLDNDTYAYPKTSFGQKMHNQYPYVDEMVLQTLLAL